MDIQKWINFDEFVTPKIITIVYVLGVIGITILSLFMLVGGGGMGGMGGNAGLGLLIGLILAIIIFVVGNILLRVYCEILIIVFKIHDHLDSVDGYFKGIKGNS